MVKIENHLGIVEISKEYFSSLIGNAASSCFGVAGMANSNAKQNISSFFFRTRQYIDQGVNVLKDADGLIIELHIIISFGLNISAIVKSIVNKVRYTVEEATGLEVKKVNVFVDSMI